MLLLSISSHNSDNNIGLSYTLDVSYVYRRASFDTSVPGAKRCPIDGEDPEEDVEEQRVSEHWSALIQISV